MPRIVYQGKTLDCREGESVLEALLRQGESPAFSCRNGSCLVCLQRCTSGDPGERSRRALRPSLQQHGYFLPCKSRPTEDLVLAPVREADLFSRAVVREKRFVSRDVCILRLETATSLYYHAGQFLNLRRSDGLARSYSLASLPTEDELLEVHVKRHPGGELSNWIHDVLAVDDELDVQGPHGRSYYVPGSQEQPLLLVGTGTGAAPLWGIVRDALHVGHRAPIVICLGSSTAEGLYLDAQLRTLAECHPNLEYLGAVSRRAEAGQFHGRVEALAKQRVPDPRGWRVYVAGHPAMVAATETWALGAGVPASELHCDPFDVKHAAPAPTPIAEGRSGVADPSTASPGDPEMWAALQDGALLNRILDDFYRRVFADPILAPYFRGVTHERLVGQVYSFLRDEFKGERHYFGMRPRTSHHWMVISDEIFDHRERLMEQTLRDHGLPEHLVERWRRYEESFRGDIVKPAPWKLVVDGVEMPLEGYGELELTVGGLCDGCQREVNVGERVRYHLRLGTTYCAECGTPPAGRP